MDARASLTIGRLARFQADLDALAPNGRIGVAVSGGPDSLALLLLSQAVRPGAVFGATVDHRLRPEAAAEAAMVAGVCFMLGVPHTTLPVTVADDPDGLQAAARKARYTALGRWAEEEQVIAIATAHHADDQAETVLMRLARGAGIAGLAGIRSARPLAEAPGISVIRPLLGWTKVELEEVVAGANLAPVRDPSNADGRYDRTQVRALLSKGWPDAHRVAASAHHLAEAEEALAWATARLAHERITFTDDAVQIDVAGLPREIRRRLVLAAFARLAPDARPRGDGLDRLLHALERGRAATLCGLKCEAASLWRVARARARRSL
jgi:tRNA(Ile)-lysidine synthase